jgi:hypothetical protein
VPHQQVTQLTSFALEQKHRSESYADSHYENGNFGEATALYEALLKSQPGRLDIQARLGRLAQLENHPESAIERFAAVINSGLRSKANWEALADAYLATDDLGAAALCYERAGRTGLAGTLAVIAQGKPYHMSGIADGNEIAWSTDSALPVIPARINGVAVNLLLDTAAGDLVLDQKVALAARVPHGGQELRHFAGGMPAMVTYGHAAELRLGSVVIHDSLVQILDLRGRFSDYAVGTEIQGILGVSILSRFFSTLDFKRRCLALAPALRPVSAVAKGEEDDTTPIWLADNQFVLVGATSPNGNTGLWVIDTGMAGAALAVSSSTGEASALSTPSAPRELGIGGGGAIEAQRVSLPGLRVAGLERSPVEGMALQTFPLKDRLGFHISGLLACDFFQDSVLRLDFSRMRLTLS